MSSYGSGPRWDHGSFRVRLVAALVATGLSGEALDYLSALYSVRQGSPLFYF